MSKKGSMIVVFCSAIIYLTILAGTIGFMSGIVGCL